MRAVGYRIPGPIQAEDSLVDIEVAKPSPTGRELLVAVRAISVNPVDTKVRLTKTPPDDQWQILGWDAAGVVVDVGPDVIQHKPGDEVFYAGSLTKPGTNAEFHLVDERIVAPKPSSLDWAQAAALPLTAITAWETLFDRLQVTQHQVPGAAPALLVIGGAGGVGSIAVQLARQLTDLTVIATASRPETASWVADLGAHHVLDHSQPLASQVADLGLGQPGFVFSTTHSEQHASEVTDIIAPQGRFALIDDPPQLDIRAFKQKSVSLHWEFMFTRPMFDTPDQSAQGELLTEVSRLVDEGVLRTTMAESFGDISAENLRRAHTLLESGKAKGKITLTGFSPS